MTPRSLSHDRLTQGGQPPSGDPRIHCDYLTLVRLQGLVGQFSLLPRLNSGNLLCSGRRSRCPARLASTQRERSGRARHFALRWRGVAARPALPWPLVGRTAPALCRQSCSLGHQPRQRGDRSGPLADAAVTRHAFAAVDSTLKSCATISKGMIFAPWTGK